MACLLESGWNTLFFTSEEAELQEPFLIVPRLPDLQPFNNDNNVHFIDVSAEELWMAVLTEEIPFAFETDEEEEQEQVLEQRHEEEPIRQVVQVRAAAPVTPFLGSAFDTAMEYSIGLDILFSEEIKQAMIQNSSFPSCPMYQCGCRLTDYELQLYTPRDVLIIIDRQYIYQKLEAFVCPGSCGLMVTAEKELPCKKLSCPKCFEDICGQCHSKFHSGSCGTTTSVSLAEYLLEANTEFNDAWTSCPLCRNAIFRESGCAHMTCSCRCQFCFYCRRKWRTANSFKDQHHPVCPVAKTGSYFATGAFPIEFAMAVPSQKEDWEAFGTSEPLPPSADTDDDDLGFGLFG